jgi:hypothetical protein
VSGSLIVTNDTTVLTGTAMPNAFALYFQGGQTVGGGLGAAFGDGLRCTAGVLLRMGIKMNSMGQSQYPEPGYQPVSVRGFCNAGNVRQYQIWYRNAASFCSTLTFNLSNGVQITWGL